MLVSISMFALAGCGAKNSTQSKNTNSVQGKTNGRNFDPSTFKTRYEEALKALVTDGKINQEQSDKVLEALTKNMGNFKPGNGQTGNSSSGVNGVKGGSSNADSNSAPPANNDANNTQNSGNGQSGQANRGPRNGQNNQLAELVTSKVITQAQADEIMQKVRGNMTTPQGDGNQTNQTSQTTKQ